MLVKMNHLELKATRQAIGLTVAEVAELFSISKRYWQYMEAGKYTVKADIVSKLEEFVQIRANIMFMLERDIRAIKAAGYNEDIEKHRVIKVSAPFFAKFEDFNKIATYENAVVFWRAYQSTISQLYIAGLISSLDDNAEIPSLSAKKYIAGDYDVSKDFDENDMI